MTTIRTTKRPPATRARDDKKYARRGDVDEDVDEALARIGLSKRQAANIILANLQQILVFGSSLRRAPP